MLIAHQVIILFLNQVRIQHFDIIATRNNQLLVLVIIVFGFPVADLGFLYS